MNRTKYLKATMGAIAAGVAAFFVVGVVLTLCASAVLIEGPRAEVWIEFASWFAGGLAAILTADYLSPEPPVRGVTSAARTAIALVVGIAALCFAAGFILDDIALKFAAMPLAFASFVGWRLVRPGAELDD